MNRKRFMATAFAMIPISIFPKMTTLAKSTLIKGFKVNSGEARNGMHYEMKGVTLRDDPRFLEIIDKLGLTPYNKRSTR